MWVKWRKRKHFRSMIPSDSGKETTAFSYRRSTAVISFFKWIKRLRENIGSKHTLSPRSLGTLFRGGQRERVFLHCQNHTLPSNQHWSINKWRETREGWLPRSSQQFYLQMLVSGFVVLLTPNESSPFSLIFRVANKLKLFNLCFYFESVFFLKKKEQ